MVYGCMDTITRKKYFKTLSLKVFISVCEVPLADYKRQIKSILISHWTKLVLRGDLPVLN